MTEDKRGSAQHLVWRNTMFLVIAQMLVVPLSIITNILVARFLGPADFGHLYLATTFAAFGFMFVEFGQSGALAGLIAEQRLRAGELLASALVWRMAATIPVAIILLVASLWLDYAQEFQIALALMLLISAFSTVSLACHDVMRGYERTDIGAVTFVIWKLLIVVVTVPVLFGGGRLQALLWAQAGCALLGAVIMLRLLRILKLPRWSFSPQAVRDLLHRGWPFFTLALVIALQENVDAAFLARYASSDAVGWYAAARKLIGLLMYPASALVAALYPTLSRLRVEDEVQFARAAGSALRVTLLCAVPLAAGCGLFPELGVWMFNGVTFKPTSDNLRILSFYILLVYFSMPLSSILMSSGRQRPWVVLQLTCVVVSAAVDPWLIPWCQSHFGNGGLGVCIATVLSEVMMVTGGIWLAQRQLFDVQLLRNAFVALLGGAAMALAAVLLHGYSPWWVAPVSLCAYAGVLFVSGLLGRSQLQQMRSLFTRR